ncbi:uncharacterized protein E0L32_010080 [Thyridium curvatum]|uniref:Uncharacterized protein n=1 Tax=Thyridium curvatum TaxID=1093900 RepID=A0A507ALK8_9PEZI|nr:uncharacterized protein E0L32_010080 [Thyridium curvatum]TPX08463.1 hypothetical protein E0L32_010080 [Thyridium curvatum]
MGPQQPFLYESDKVDSRFPTSSFDPKAVTRASWEPKPKKPKQNGPLISINRHPDAHEVIGQRRPFRTLGHRTKAWIKGMRKVQLGLRVLEMIGAAGILTLMILINHVSDLVAWVARITAGVVIVHCVYGIYHLSRHAGGRTPASSAAYQLFAAVSDLCVLPLYTYVCLSTRNSSEGWGTLVANETLLPKYFIPALYYTLIGAGGLHLLSLAIGLWLALKFRQITRMPPDMNPLEAHLTSRAHKRNKSSVATSSTFSESEKRLSTPLEDRRRSGMPYQDLSRPPSIPFTHTRTGSSTSLHSRDSRLDLPSRQYQIPASNRSSPRSSLAPSELDRSGMKRMSHSPLVSGGPDRRSGGGLASRASYIEIPLHETGSPRASTGTVASQVTIQSAGPTAQPRAAKFTEAWYTSESLINRTQQRNKAINTMMLQASSKRRNYEAVHQRGGAEDDSDSDASDRDENAYDLGGLGARGNGMQTPEQQQQTQQDHPNPLRSNPMAQRPRTPYYRPAMGEVSSNARSASGSQDIADAQEQRSADSPRPLSTASSSKKRHTWAPQPQPRNRDSSIQPDSGFYSKPYGELKSATPPIMVGSGRQVSSGNDYDLGERALFPRQRGVSGKIAEEGRAGLGQNGFSSRFSVLNA